MLAKKRIIIPISIFNISGSLFNKTKIPTGIPTNPLKPKINTLLKTGRSRFQNITPIFTIVVNGSKIATAF